MKYHSLHAYQVQSVQRVLAEQIHLAMRDKTYVGEKKDNLLAAYNETVESLLHKQGGDVPAADVDCELYEVFCNVYKDAVGVKPREHSYKEMKEWMDAH